MAEITSLHPTNVQHLSSGAQLFVFSIRQWLIAAKGSQCIYPTLAPFYRRYKVEDAIAPLDELMFLLARTAERPIEINCPCKLDLREDELSLLQILRAVQSDDKVGAFACLSEWVSGPIKTTFLRVADAYLETLAQGGLKVTGVSHLQLVGGQEAH